MVPNDDGIAPVMGISLDRPAPSGRGLSEGARQSEATSKPAATKGARSGSSAVDAPKMQLPGDDAYITFEKDDVSGKMVMQLKDSSGKVIRQIPPEEMIRLAKAIDRYLGLLVDRHS